MVYVQVALMVKNVACNTSMFDDSIPTTVMDPKLGWVSGSMIVSVRNN